MSANPTLKSPNSGPRLLISHKREEQAIAFAVRQWLIDDQSWSSEDIFVDLDHPRAGDNWEQMLLDQAVTEGGEALFRHRDLGNL